MNKIMEMRFGSHLYGTNTENSDLDMKAIYIPSAREIILGNYKKTITVTRNKKEGERNTKDDIDVEMFSLDRYLELLMEGQTVALDITFGVGVDDIESDLGSEIFITIIQNLDKLLTRNVNAFVGYARQQAAKYGIKGSRMDALKSVMEMLELFYYQDKLIDHKVELEALVERSSELISLEKTPLIEIVDIKGPNGSVEPHLHVCGRKIPFHAKVQFAKQVFGKILEGYGSRARKANLDGGIDWKALSHAVRVNNEALELLNTGKITFPRPEAQLLLDIKLGKIEYEKVAEMIEQGLADLTEAHKTSKLRDEPDKEWAKDFLYSVYLEEIKRTT
jgi:hypothetical protein